MGTTPQSTTVTRDATLEAFETDEDGDDGADAGTDDDAGDASAPDDGVEPPLPTTDWSPKGASCDACGAVVKRRWRQADALVCPDCKNWDGQ